MSGYKLINIELFNPGGVETVSILSQKCVS